MRIRFRALGAVISMMLLCFWPTMATTLRVGESSSGAATAGQTAGTFTIGSAILVSDTKRLGVNLGTWTSWGAEQLASNVIKNPGFEGLIDRAIVIVKRSDPRGFADDTSWLGRADGFWSGARFDIRTGPSAGASGLIADSRQAGKDGLPEFQTSNAMPAVNPGDVIALTRASDIDLPKQWWIPQASAGLVSVNTTDKRPGSSGIRSVSLNSTTAQPAEIISYLDAIGDRAGKLLPINGKWRLSFWSRLSEGQSDLAVELVRQGSKPFVSQPVTQAKKWTKTTIVFHADDMGPASILELHFRTAGGPARILLDDVQLTSAANDSFPFRQEVIDALTQLHPGYLRDWQGQLGDTMGNLLADPFARRSSRYRPGADDSDFGYSLPEFLDLCVQVKANPWIVMPTTVSDDEARALGQYLAGRAQNDGFAEVLVEFGNENWNPLFRPAGISDPAKHGEAATRAFSSLRQGAGTAMPLRLVVNGQHANPDFAMQFIQNTPADILAVAPYFAYSLDAGIPRDIRLSNLFAGDGGRMNDLGSRTTQLGKDLAIYEVNLHTVEGSALAVERDPTTAGAAAGSALARRMLDDLSVGVRRQCAYVLAGYDAYLSNSSGLAKLWGLTRDIAGPGHLRPTGLALSMINQAIQGDMLIVSGATAGADVSVYAFRSAAGCSVILVSSSAAQRQVTVAFPTDASLRLPRNMLMLDAPAPDATNEDQQYVSIITTAIDTSGGKAVVTLPPFGLAVLLPRGSRQ